MRIILLATALLSAQLVAPATALACSKVSLLAPLDDRKVYFVGTASADTLLAGPGEVEFGVGGGHFGQSVPRAIHGLVVRVEALASAASSGLPEGVQEIVVVPWDYDPSCRPLVWGRSARWVPEGTSAFYVADLRAPQHWVDGRPTVDVHNPGHLPYTGTEPIRGMHPDTPVDSLLTPAQLFGLYRVLPTHDRIQHDRNTALDPLRAWIDDHPELVRRAPADMLVNAIVRTIDRAEVSEVDHPIRGVWRFNIHLPDTTRHTVYGRVDPASVSRWTPSHVEPEWTPERLLLPTAAGLQMMMVFAEAPDALQSLDQSVDHRRGYLYTLTAPTGGEAAESGWSGLLDSSFLRAALPGHPVAGQVFLEFTRRYGEIYRAGLPAPTPATFVMGPDGVLRVEQAFPLPDGREVVVEGEQLCLLSVALTACGPLDAPKPPDAAAAQLVPWPAYGGGPANIRYSPLNQVDRDNVRQLEVAWTYRTGDPGETQCQPIIIERTLYCTSAALKAFALDAATGEVLWTFDPFVGGDAGRPHVNRGVAYWEGEGERRIFFTAGPRLYALNADDGQPIPTFGDDGSVDLRDGLARSEGSGAVIATSPGAVYRDLLIQGTRVSEADGAAPGHVRAYDVRTGEVRWTFHTIPQPGEFGHETWPSDAWESAGGANSWAGISVDTARGMAFVPTGSATPDFYGGGRHGSNLFANTLLALDASTGERIWHFQTVHHDVWDRDLPAPPNLVTVTHRGRPVEAVAQITKSGFVFLFERLTGDPLFPIEERPFPPSDLIGESTWPTQPVPLRPTPFARQSFTEAEVTRRTPAARAAVLERLRTLRSGGQFVPPSREGTVILPGFDGGGEWGGAAFDPESGLLYVNANEMAWIATMVEEGAASSGGAPATAGALYQVNCAGCHGGDRAGTGDRGPSLVRIVERRTAAEIRRIITEGAGFMPSFVHLREEERGALLQYLLTDGADADRPVGSGAPTGERGSREEPIAPDSNGADGEVRYRFAGYERFLDPDGYPAVAPPWGTLSAIDLNEGEIRWQVPLGDVPEAREPGGPATGTENYGGPVVTAGGLVFIAATKDARFRAFDKATGEVLWEAELPAGGYATPAVYAVGGRQFVVIAAGGGKMNTESADAYVAYALPR